MIFSLTPSSIQPGITASIQIAGVNFGDPNAGAMDTVQICPLSSTGAVSGGCDSQDVTPASDTLIVVDVTPQASLYGYAVTVISDEDEESNQASLGVSTAAPVIYDTPPQITGVTPGDIPALSGQAVTITGTNLGSAGSLSICQGANNCLPWTSSAPWGNTEVDLIVDASTATPGTTYTVTLSTSLDSLGNLFSPAPRAPADSSSASLEIDPAPAPTISLTSVSWLPASSQGTQYAIMKDSTAVGGWTGDTYGSNGSTPVVNPTWQVQNGQVTVRDPVVYMISNPVQITSADLSMAPAPGVETAVLVRIVANPPELTFPDQWVYFNANGLPTTANIWTSTTTVGFVHNQNYTLSWYVSFDGENFLTTPFATSSQQMFFVYGGPGYITPFGGTPQGTWTARRLDFATLAAEGKSSVLGNVASGT